MNVYLDDFLVGLVLIAGFGYAIYALGPKSLRPPIMGPKGKGACGGCDNCGSESPTVPTPDGEAPEIRIPLSKIGKRR